MLLFERFFKMAHRGETSIKIQEFQWEKFWNVVDSYQLTDPKEVSFIRQYVAPNDYNER